MATLQHHIQPLMQRSIAEAEERLERKWSTTQSGRSLRFISVWSFELRVLARPAPQVDVSTPQAAFESLRANIDMILEARVPESMDPSVEPAEDTLVAALFATSEIPPPPA